jgi:DNA-binding Lrp family transcriptional regulator
MKSFSDGERAVLRELAGGLPRGPEPYAVIAERAGPDELDEKSVLGIIRGLMARGAIRRVAAILHDRKLGYDGNAMVAWRVPAEELDRAGAAAAERPEISHAYARRTAPDWPYNLYTMIHARSREEAMAVVKELGRRFRASDHRVLFSLREFTKRRPDYSGVLGE